MQIKECADRLKLLVDEFNEQKRKTDNKQEKLRLLSQMEMIGLAINLYIKKLKDNTERYSPNDLRSLSEEFSGEIEQSFK